MEKTTHRDPKRMSLQPINGVSEVVEIYENPLIVISNKQLKTPPLHLLPYHELDPLPYYSLFEEVLRISS